MPPSCVIAVEELCGMVYVVKLFERSEFLIHTPQKKYLYRLYGNKRLHVERVFDKSWF